MALKKSQLYRSLWQSCDELRGGMDASQYKDYVLTLLFMKYATDKYKGQRYAPIEVPDKGGFDDMVALRGDKEIGDKINKIIARFAEANELKGVIDVADFNDAAKLGTGKEMQDRLARLVAIFEGLDFRRNRAHGDDLLGDAYEYLMAHFAQQSGKSKGQFYTPAEVSRIMAAVVGIERAREMDQPTLYDPTCGSGSLLIKAADRAATPKLALYGQEKDSATWALARMNMFMHGYASAVIERGNTLTSPRFLEGDQLKTFDFALANPPFSDKAWSTGLVPDKDDYARFVRGVPPTKNGDFAFLLHLLASLNSRGTGAIILPHGVLFRGNREADIRRRLVEEGLIKGIIGLPANLFYGTGIPACIIVLDKREARQRDAIFMIDASQGYEKDGNKNRLRAQDIQKIIESFTNERLFDGYSRRVPLAEIADPKNDYNLNLPRYIDAAPAEDLHSLVAHLGGGIPTADIDALDSYWGLFPTLRKALFRPDPARDGMSVAQQPVEAIKATVLGHPEFRAYAAQVAADLEAWEAAHAPTLRAVGPEDKVPLLVEALGDDLLERFSERLLLDPYDVYQQLMSYWEAQMQDDLYLITEEGWQPAAMPRPLLNDPLRGLTESPDLTIGRKKYKMDLLPPSLLVGRYFADDQAALEQAQAAVEAAQQALTTFEEEQGGEESLLEEVTSERGTISKGAVKARLRALDDEAESDEERAALTEWVALADAERAARNQVKALQKALDQKVLAHYRTLSVAEIQALVIEDKWFATIRSGIQGEVERLIQQLVSRIQELEARYAEPMPALEEQVYQLSEKVTTHLREMGLEWEIS
ncbi:MAG: SAM-dependent DNA methyltransferase [Ardenticatenales bacterium]|nr:SAM-dependent DNA methyltransferase [Ardenticatenales bacterium]